MNIPGHPVKRGLSVSVIPRLNRVQVGLLGCMLALGCTLGAGCGFFGYDPLLGDAAIDAGMDATVPDTGVDSGVDSGVDTGVDGGLDCSLGTCRRVFVTSAGLSNGAIGGVLAADAYCQAVATGAGLGSTWKAWLSDSTSTAAARLAHSVVPYLLTDGTLVANGWTDLVDGTLAHAIDVTEATDTLASVVEVWTGTTTAGAYAAVSCSDWTNATSAMPSGRVGRTTAASQWTDFASRTCDLALLRLYCFEQ